MLGQTFLNTTFSAFGGSTSLASNFLYNGINANFAKRKYSAASPSLPAFNYKPKEYKGPTYDKVKELRQKFLTPALLTYYKNPVMFVEGKMQYLFDHTGRRYLDMFAGIVTVSVGHCHPAIVEAATRQTETIMHTTTIYYHPEVAQFGEELAAKMPGNLKVCYFVNSGSEANDLAILMARIYTGNFDIICLRNGYHGMSYGTMGLTALNTWKYPTPQGIGYHHALNPDTFRGPFGPDTPNVGEKYANDVKDLILHATSGRIAGYIAESIQGVGGTVTLPDGYLKAVYKHIRDHGGVCIADEVQTGFGRTGTKYWGFENQDVLPDIVTMAKGIGNGAPLAAVVTTPEIAKALAQRIHFNTYGGNPVSSAIGRAVLKVIDNEGIQKNALEMGNALKEGLLKLQKKYSIIGEVRGKGLMIGMELVKDKKTKTPAKDETSQVFERAKELGLIIGKGGLYGNVFRIKPPMCINKEDVKFTLDVLDNCLQNLDTK